MSRKNHIPVYSLDEFRVPSQLSNHYQIEVFDAKRHFEVSYPHKHDFYEVLFLTNGSGYHLIDSNKYKIVPPCIFYLSPGQTHRLELSNDIRGYIFLFTAEFYLLNQKNNNKLMEFPFFYSVEQNNPPLYLTDKDEIELLSSLFNRGIKEIQSPVCSEEILRSVLELILLTTDKLYPDKIRKIRATKGHILVKNYLRLIEENYQKNYRIGEYAEMLAITPNHLTQMVKQNTGKSSVQLLHEKIIVEIKRMLLHTTLSITEIASFFSFTDQSYFTKYFKRFTGITPLQYRKNALSKTKKP